MKSQLTGILLICTLLPAAGLAQRRGGIGGMAPPRCGQGRGMLDHGWRLQTPTGSKPARGDFGAWPNSSSWWGIPYGDGYGLGYGLGDYGYGYGDYQSSMGPVIVVSPPAETAKPESPPAPPPPAQPSRTDYSWPAGQRATPPAWTIHLKDGRDLVVSAMWRQDGELAYTMLNGTAGRIPLTVIDRAATEQRNAEAGMKQWMLAGVP